MALHQKDTKMRWLKCVLFAPAALLITEARAYCVPDNETCFECGTNCVAELTYSKDSNNNDVGTFTVYGTGENGQGSMDSYSYTGTTPDRTTTAPWKDKLGDINNVVISNGITNVGGFTFSGAKNVSHLELPETVTEVGKWAFLESTLETVNTLKNVTSFGPAAFFLTNLESADLNENLTEISGDLFYGTKISEIDIPDGVTSIGHNAFSACKNLSVIEIPDKVDTIDKRAFSSTTAKIYCNNVDGRCDKLFFGEVSSGISEGQLVRYTINGGYYIYDGQRYRNLKNMESGVAAKRIYTINEANEASGKKNSVMIRYK